MSPRSAEFFARAQERASGARHALERGDLEIAISAAYYAMLYAARAALSEEDLYAKTHSGVWHLFHRTFVEPGHFDAKLHAQAQATQELRQGIDYDAEPVDRPEADRIVGLAQRYVSATGAMLGE